MTRRLLRLPIVFLLVIPAIVQGAAQQSPSRNRGSVVLADSPAVHQELKLVEEEQNHGSKKGRGEQGLVPLGIHPEFMVVFLLVQNPENIS